MYRDQLNAILSFKEKQSHVATDFEERDVIALARKGSFGVAVVLRIRNGRIFSRDKLLLKQLDDNDETTLKTIDYLLKPPRKPLIFVYFKPRFN